MRSVQVPAARVVRWFQNFETRHGSYALSTSGGALVARAEDGAEAIARLPWGQSFEGSSAEELAAAAGHEIPWGLLIVRKGGFAVAAGSSPTPALTKVGRRHVQGKTKAGGWSQQRYARRRDNQAQAAYDAAADHAHRILVEERQVEALVCGGDRRAVETVLEDPRLGRLADRVEPWLAVPDPNAAVLAKAVADAWSCRVQVTDPAPPEVSSSHLR